MNVKANSSRRESRLRRWGGYAFGIVIEVAAVITLSFLSLLVLYAVKVIIS